MAKWRLGDFSLYGDDIPALDPSWYSLYCSSFQAIHVSQPNSVTRNAQDEVEVPVVDHRQCQRALRRTRLGRHFRLHSSFMCAGAEPGRDTCKGDGGSPLVCPSGFDDNRYVQAGIVAWGIGCGEDGTPGVYVDVADLRAWIDVKVADRVFDPKVYTLE